MKLELVSHALCPFVHRAAIVLREKGVDVDVTYIDLAAKPQWFLAISPRGKVPVLIADGVPLFESAAIVEFLDETHPPRLVPEDPFERARQRAWVEVATDLLTAQYRAIVAPTTEALGAATREIEALLMRFEEAIARGGIDLDRFGLLQVAVAPALFRFVILADRLGAPFLAATPRVEAWARAIAARPSVAGTVPDDFTERLVQLIAQGGGVLTRGGADEPRRARGMH